MGKPVLEHQIDLCKLHGFFDIALLVHYRYEAIESYFGDGSRFGVRLRYVVEREARGTAGALRDALEYLDDQFIVMYADTFADIDLTTFWKAALSHQAAGVLLLHPNDHPHDSDIVEIDEAGAVTSIHAYPHPDGSDYRNLVNAALYVLKKEALPDVIPAVGKFDLAKHAFPSMLEAGRRLQSYITPEYIKDMGTPARLDKVEHDLVAGLPERLSGRHRRQAVFLDRDGTLNREVHHLKDPEQLALLPSVCDAVHSFNRAGVLAVAVTNQPVLARGDITWGGLARVHARLDKLLGEGRAYLDRVYVCPHHPDSGFTGEVPELKRVCGCRKPAAGLIDLAVDELGIDRARSWIVGDTTGDILAGQAAGIRSVLVRTGYAGRDYKYDAEPNYIFDSLAEAASWILTDHAATTSKLMPIAHAYRRERIILIGGPSRAGKSTAARVLQEVLQTVGRTSHVISLDSWLKPVVERRIGEGVMSRYDLASCAHTLARLRDSRDRETVMLNTWDRKTGVGRPLKRLSIGPQDVLLVEGVPALADPSLRALTKATVHVDTADSTRMERLWREYRWREIPEAAAHEKIESREIDEVLPVRAAAAHAKYCINLGNNE
jgi:histidinol-phosphate phosphatase family protein